MQQHTPGGSRSTGGSATPLVQTMLRSSDDIRSPGAHNTPKLSTTKTTVPVPPVPDFITQTDANGKASTPRPVEKSSPQTPSSSVPFWRNLFLCCCTLDDYAPAATNSREGNGKRKLFKKNEGSEAKLSTRNVIGVPPSSRPSSSPGPKFTSLNPNVPLPPPLPTMLKSLLKQTSSTDPFYRDIAGGTFSKTNERLLPKQNDDKPCLVLDLDETLVHSSFRSVAGADFVIPVKIEDVVHYVYVAKRPSVDLFLTQLAQYYEIVIYTASLNKYADPLLDLLDPKGVISHRLFRESCVQYGGNYIKDLSVIDRNLKRCIIIDNSPSSYIFQPENAIGCTSFIDDKNDRELDHIRNFLIALKDVPDVRMQVTKWKEYKEGKEHDFLSYSELK